MAILRKLIGKSQPHHVYLKVETFDLLQLVEVTIDGRQVWPFSGGAPDASGSDPATAFFKLGEITAGQTLSVAVAGEPRSAPIPAGPGHMLFVDVAADHTVTTYFMEPEIERMEAAAALDDRDRYPCASAQFSVEPGTQSPVTVAAVSHEHDEAKAEYEEFCATFCVRPGTSLMELLRTQGHRDLLRWLDPSSDEAEPKAVVRLLVEATRQGLNLWDQRGITLYLEGRWSRGGPSDQTRQALGFLAEALHLPVTLYHRKAQGSDQVTKMEWTPNE